MWFLSWLMQIISNNLKKIDKLKYVGGQQKWDFSRVVFWRSYQPNSIRKKHFHFGKKAVSNPWPLNLPSGSNVIWGLDFICKTSVYLINFFNIFNEIFNNFINFSNTLVHKVSEFVINSIFFKSGNGPFWISSIQFSNITFYKFS